VSTETEDGASDGGDADEDELPELPGEDTIGDTISRGGIARLFGDEAPAFVDRAGGRGYVVRLSGGPVGESIDAVLLAEVLDGLGKAGRWSASALLGVRQAPRVRSAAARSSLVIEFEGAPEEESFAHEQRRITATAYSGAWLGRLLALPDQEAILEGSQPLKKRAVVAFARTLSTLGDKGVGVDWLALDEPRRPRRLRADPDQVSHVAGTLSQTGGIRRSTRTLTGLLLGAHLGRGRFELEVTAGDWAGRILRGQFPADIEESVVEAFGWTVDVQVRATLPRYPELPRAPRATYELLRVLRRRYLSTGQ